MQRMAKERDMAIRESRLQAQTTADLREHIRYIITDTDHDTFLRMYPSFFFFFSYVHNLNMFVLSVYSLLQFLSSILCMCCILFVFLYIFTERKCLYLLLISSFEFDPTL